MNFAISPDFSYDDQLSTQESGSSKTWLSKVFLLEAKYESYLPDDECQENDFR